MKRLFIATTLLILLVGATLWFLRGTSPDRDADLHTKMQQITKFKDVKPLADNGDKEAQYRLGVLYEKGQGVSKNGTEAAVWYRKAADQGHAGAQYSLGQLYENGNGVRQDLFLAFKWYRVAATFGNNREAYFALGLLNFTGRGVDQDYGQAIKYYREAASRGHPVAQHILGAMYEEGWGVNRDLIMAYIWYTLAAPKAEETLKFNRNYDPVKALAKLKSVMNRYQTEEAEKRLAKLRQGKR